MPVIYKCPNCGAAMEFDSDTQKLGCKRCGTQIDVETYEKDSAASGEQREKVPNMKIYNCQSCGAQLVADEYTSATFCSYCGNPTLVEDRLQGEFKPQLIIPFTDAVINLGPLYVPIMTFMIVGIVNAVNLTDGLDGLAAGLSAIAIMVYGMIAWNSGWLAGYDDVAVFCFILVGGLLGFLVYNGYPAKVFMGDTGSLALGAVLATLAILTHREMSLIVVGGVFVIETLSVILQVASVKIRGKKLFPMTPIHHTFEKLGWSETDIVRLFYVVGFILGTGALVYGVWY